MALGNGSDFSDVPSHPTTVSMYPWLLLAAGAVSDTAAGKLHPAWLAAAGLAAFALLYIAAIWTRWRAGRAGAACLLLAALGAVTLALNIAFGSRMSALFPLLAIVCGAVLPWMTLGRGGHGPPVAFLGVFTVAYAGAATAWSQGASPGQVWQAWYDPALTGAIVAVLYRFMAAVAELRRTRDELARSAVEAERLRFARDLHDLLGHTLSVIVVKAQVARRLTGRDPELAARQVADIEDTGRRALTEVRQAVDGYRGAGLSRELEAARTALASAGLTMVVTQDGQPVPAEADTVLGWVVREGVTNVIRHSGGARCEIEVRHRDASVTLAISDDGGGTTAGEPLSAKQGPGGRDPGGHGLDGLRERVTAEGGTLEAAPRPGGGFQLTATVPAGPRPAPGRADAGTAKAERAGARKGTNG